MQGNTLQSTSYHPVRQYICLQIIQCKVPQPGVGQYHFTQLSKVDDINHLKKHTHTHTRARAHAHTHTHTHTHTRARARATKDGTDT